MREREKLNKFCLNCNEKIVNRNSFCNNRCQLEFQNHLKIKRWLNGENFFRKGGNSIPQWIRNFLLGESNYSCSVCGWNKKNEKTGFCPLEVDHVDGNSTNNIRSNLRVLCPNCHSLTTTYKNIGNRKSNRLRK